MHRTAEDTIVDEIYSEWGFSSWRRSGAFCSAGIQTYLNKHFLPINSSVLALAAHTDSPLVPRQGVD